jgi:uncharacterized protein (DUF924 family)
MIDSTRDDILEFWFGPSRGLAPSAAGATRAPSAREAWFRKDPAFDDAIRARFAPAVEAALAGAYADWTDAAGALARVLLLDQFTRNLFRDTARAFAGDARALAVAQAAIAAGHEGALDRYGRWFLYLPFEHSEDAAMQQRSLALFGTLAAATGDRVPLEWAEKHAAVIRRFGRYPHRNAILGRASTAAEAAFLREPGSRF